MILIHAYGAGENGNREVIPVHPATFKEFWPEVRNSYSFRNRRQFLDFMITNRGRIFVLPDPSLAYRPFVMTGNWRSRSDITAIWYLHARGSRERERLVVAASEICLQEGSERVVTRPLDPYEAQEYGAWGFTTLHRIVILEKRMTKSPPRPPEGEGVRVVRFRRNDLAEVLSLDGEAFDDFWRMDRPTMERVASSCMRNVFLLAKRGEEALGYAIGGVNEWIGYLQRLGVRPDCRRLGVGETLLAHLLRRLYALGAFTVSVNTQEDNLPARNLYQKLGFKETQDRRYIMERSAAERPGSGR